MAVFSQEVFVSLQVSVDLCEFSAVEIYARCGSTDRSGRRKRGTGCFSSQTTLAERFPDLEIFVLREGIEVVPNSTGEQLCLCMKKSVAR